MKLRYYKNIFSKALMLSMVFGGTSCINDLDISSIDPQTSPSFDQNMVFVKEYALLGLTGQQGPAGSADLDGQDEGESGFYRTVFNCNELPSDECVWAWQDNVDIPQLTNINWNSSSIRTEWLYVRLGYNITQLNFFLDKTEGKTDAETLRQRSEIRFLRALHYSYYLDFFGKAPFKEHFDENELPVEKAGADLYAYIQKELSECEAAMYEPRKAPFGRADKVANWLLRARLYLNAEVYTGTPNYAKAEEYATKAIGSGYELCPVYSHLFMADNDQNKQAMQEIILPIRQDGAKTRNYGGSTYLVCATRTGGMPRMGTSDGWSCVFARKALINKFFPDLSKVPMLPSDIKVPSSSEIDTDQKIDAFDQQYGTKTVDMIAAAKDHRAMFYSGIGGGVRKLSTTKISGFKDGLSIVKWQNLRTDGKATNDSKFPDTDIPFLRLAEAYLTRAEARFRQGTDAKEDLNMLRKRANAIVYGQTYTVTEQTLIDEWAREFYLEGRRRSDLVRFGLFTTNKYLWDWKGGTAEGTSVASFYNVYPIPASDKNNNKNMTQNKGY